MLLYLVEQNDCLKAFFRPWFVFGGTLASPAPPESKLRSGNARYSGTANAARFAASDASRSTIPFKVPDV